MLTVIQSLGKFWRVRAIDCQRLVFHTKIGLEAALPPFLVYYTTQLLKAPCRACWSSFLNVLASTSAGTAMDCQRLDAKKGQPLRTAP